MERDNKIFVSDVSMVAWFLLNGVEPLIEHNTFGRVTFVYPKTKENLELLSTFHTATVSLSEYIDNIRKAKSLLFGAKGRSS
jgi:hypothetical protein